ncbi:hypothetical protein B0H13DRAFT_2385075 [Mycena leptocephala]|nr:hypothetical protein B0H13DRAFT_2385075 [Mycena leptocephala]
MPPFLILYHHNTPGGDRLRQVDLKAEHLERQARIFEQERDQWEKRCEAAEEKYREAKAELDELVVSIEGQ